MGALSERAALRSAVLHRGFPASLAGCSASAMMPDLQADEKRKVARASCREPLSRLTVSTTESTGQTTHSVDEVL
jgi:hypothetical protein